MTFFKASGFKKKTVYFPSAGQGFLGVNGVKNDRNVSNVKNDKNVKNVSNGSNDSIVSY